MEIFAPAQHHSGTVPFANRVCNLYKTLLADSFCIQLCAIKDVFTELVLPPVYVHVLEDILEVLALDVRNHCILA